VRPRSIADAYLSLTDRGQVRERQPQPVQWDAASD